MEGTPLDRTPLGSPRGLLIGARFLARVPAFMRRRFTLDEARAIQAARLREREHRFLHFVERAVFARPTSVLSKLFEHAGVPFQDLRELVLRQGLDEALQRLFEAGVYMTSDEFKGRVPLVRGSLRLEVEPGSLRNPIAAFHVAARSGGSRSRAAPFLMDLAYIRACAVACALYLDAHGGSGWTKATWETPGAGSRFRLLKYSSFGERPVAWFTQVHPSDGLDPVFRWSDRALRWGGALAGVRVPRPVLASPEDPLPLARWARSVLDAGAEPHWFSFSSSVVRLATAAREAGIDLSGSHSTLAGEPITEARVATIRSAGIEPLPRYGTIEAGPIGYACRNPDVADHMHLVRDLHAIIQAGVGGPGAGLPGSAVLLTALHPAAPFCMINFSMGDQAVVDAGSCGCPLEGLGWQPRISHVRSFEKLTAGGVTFDDAEITRLLEETLPGRFGGSPTDYQLVEEESRRGDSVLVLRVHPRVGPVPDGEVLEALVSGLGIGSPVHRMMERHLRMAVDVRVERSAPLITRSSKIMHLHVRPRGD